MARPDSRADNSEALYVETFGSGRRLALVHGFTQTGRSWRPVVDRLSSQFELVTIDLPGHGKSSSIEATSIDEGARLVGDAGGPASYIGYSLGGRTCLSLALNDPARVEALVLVGATPGIDDDDERMSRRATDDALAARIDGSGTDPFSSLEEFFSFWLAGPLFSHLTPEQSDLDARRENTPAGLSSSLRTMGTGTQAPLRSGLFRLSMPVLLLSGENDARFSAIANEMASAIGENATAKTVSSAGHAAPFENPEEFCALVRSFLADVSHRPS